MIRLILKVFVFATLISCATPNTYQADNQPNSLANTTGIDTLSKIDKSLPLYLTVVSDFVQQQVCYPAYPNNPNVYVSQCVTATDDSRAMVVDSLKRIAGFTNIQTGLMVDTDINRQIEPNPELSPELSQQNRDVSNYSEGGPITAKPLSAPVAGALPKVLTPASLRLVVSYRKQNDTRERHKKVWLHLLTLFSLPMDYTVSHSMSMQLYQGDKLVKRYQHTKTATQSETWYNAGSYKQQAIDAFIAEFFNDLTE
ncbi:hypothetical protein HR060_07070 [Catenovulum sp. SM1970]|uniref:hypothetical protein n=1 Tax=Marinifaba aquimaris TaxID=2741323 RepID=UPI0015730731|nr:hypothetical protein [Marinifaba aquimaris]NTS76628.1 hypothetical protein [Marinifaba aquimaris]